MIRRSEYNAYINARQRCHNPDKHGFKYYGGKGIKFLYNSYEEFLMDVGKKSSCEHTLGRINGKDDYRPGNCEWQTWTQQSRNRPNVNMSMAKARKVRQLYSRGNFTQRELAKIFGVHQRVIWGIINNIYWKEDASLA
jgi:hypothetical protein